LAQLAVHSPNEQGYSLTQGIIRKGAQIWVGENSALRTKLIAAFHDSVLGGRSGTQATYCRIKKLFQWKGLKGDVGNFVRQCLVFQQAKHERTHPAGLLQPLPIPKGAWQDISMDFIEGLSRSEGYNYILVAVDRFLKYAHFIPLTHPFTAQKVAKVMLDVVVRLHGMPVSIVSDRDKIFTIHFWKELFRLSNTTLITSTAYHSQTDGQTERVNQCLEMFLRCSVHNTPRQWKSWLPLAEFWYNTTFHTSLGCAPFKAMYGYDPNVTSAPMISPTDDKYVQDLLTDRQMHIDLLKQQLQTAQNRMKGQADKRRTDIEFPVGDQVLLKLQPYAQSSVVNQPFPKLSYKYFGPFTVEEKVGSVAYRLKLPQDSLIHLVFHVSQLKPFTPDFKPVFSKLPVLVDFSQETLQPEEILERRLVKKGNAALPQVRVRWAGLPETSSTWEDWNVLITRFPSVASWGQDGATGGGGVTHAGNE
jgi:hypothetical protein